MNGPARPSQLHVAHWSWLLTPVIVASYPVVSLYVENMDEAALGDALACEAAMVVVAICIAFGFRLLFRSPTRAGIGAALFIVWLFGFIHFKYCAEELEHVFSLRNVVGWPRAVAWLMLLIVSLFLLRSSRWSDGLVSRGARLIQLATLLMIGFASLEGGIRAEQTSHFLPTKEAAGSTLPMPGGSQHAAADIELKTPTVARDVYYLVFDRYPNAETLREQYDYDNSPFYRALEDRGFHVERNCRACYPLTVLSMSSTLNMRYHGAQFENRSDYFPALRRHEVGRLFIKAGYVYHHFGNSYNPLRRNQLAQFNYRVSFLPSEFADTLMDMTPIGTALSIPLKYRFVYQKAAAVRALATDEKLTFAYAHFLTPHPAFVQSANGTFSWQKWATQPGSKAAFLDELIATNRLILTIVDDLISKSDVTPIIILQADEGPYLSPSDHSLPMVDQMKKRTGILSAMLIPDEQIARRIPARMTSVNTFRFLFREYFQVPLEPLPDRTFYWERPNAHGTPTHGTRILDVTDELAAAS